jgi:transglutaminase-like putative cysteine protease
MQDDVKATRLCDCNDPWLRKKAEEITGDASTPEDRALKIFYYVRDNIRFSLAFSRSKASQPLKRGYGDRPIAPTNQFTSFEVPLLLH